MLTTTAGIIFLIGLGFHVALMARFILTRKSKGYGPDRSTTAFGVMYGIALLFFTAWSFAGLVDDRPLTPLAALVSTTAILLLTQATLNRKRVFTYLASTNTTRRHRVEWFLLLLFGLLAVLTLEWPWSEAVVVYGPTYWWLELAIVLPIALFFYFLGRRHGSMMIPVLGACSFIGLAQFFIRRFKNAAILPNDLLALDTAMAVSRNYTYSISQRAIIGLTVGMCALCVLSMLHPCWSVQRDDPNRGHRASDVAKGFASLAFTAVLILVPNYMKVFQVQMMYWYGINYYENQGFLPTFIAVAQDIPIRAPEGYDTDKAEALTQELAKGYDEGTGHSGVRQAAEQQFNAIKPAVVVVMNESFSDLSDFDNMHCGYEGPQFFKTLPDALYRGKLSVNVHGGGTCNTEFEFLTGNSLAYVGVAKYPYSTFVLDGTDNLAAQFNALGYKTTAIHPNYPGNWSRNKVYTAFGFANFLDIWTYGGIPETNPNGSPIDHTPDGTPVFHSGVTDKVTYESILKILKDDSSPQFIFDVTMQNHGAYNQKNIPEDKLTHYQPESATHSADIDELNEQMNEFVSCIEESDRALEWFVGELKSLDRPVLLIFFGDHQPSISLNYADLWYPDDDDMTRAKRIYHADYLMWANYDVEGNAQNSMQLDLSADVMGSLALGAIGAPLNDYQKAQLSANKHIKAMNPHGYLGADGIWYTPDEDSPYAELYRQMSYVEYHHFGERL